MTTERWYRISLPERHTRAAAVFALSVLQDAESSSPRLRTGYVRKTAPIANWAKGYLWTTVRDYYLRRGATIEELKGEEEVGTPNP